MHLEVAESNQRAQVVAQPGKRADVIVIDLQQPKTQPVYAVESAIVYAASGSAVVTTICDGKVSKALR